MVATDHETARRQQQIADFPWPKRARDAITEIDGSVYATLVNVSQHSFQRRHVAVYVGEDGDPHWITYAPPSCE
jgi:hypothetical protein